MSYKLKLEIFEGPLDLLLYLIKKSDIDIKNIPISKITEQYMQYINMMKLLDLDIVGDFLVMAATLMQIKSKMLLPPDPSENEEEEEDPRDELVRRLNEYKRFKEIAEALKDKEMMRKNLFARTVDHQEINKLKDDAKEVYFEASLFDLISALSEALKKVPEEVILDIIKENFTVEQKIHDILHLLLDEKSVSLTSLFAKCASKIEMVVSFLAILELIRLKEIKAIQKRVFENIEIMRNTDNMVPEDQGKKE
ncbi:MAG: segregation/condensation protein A [Candidatus Omnitrophica bacterium]|nr:segregation/condensation protein A [Candidatus Omnitrophota bacterium]MBU1997317.1 segregation/condensation protein A [Candidatus Omnitrophota bacterium]MBU4334322.1 segregation/condensation protein A [Candidatus Omnitrophota bacterium]